MNGRETREKDQGADVSRWAEEERTLERELPFLQKVASLYVSEKGLPYVLIQGKEVYGIGSFSDLLTRGGKLFGLNAHMLITPIPKPETRNSDPQTL